MDNRDFLMSLSKEELVELVGIYSRNMLAMDGVWFQSVERKFGMDEAMRHDAEAWARFTRTEARRIKKFLGLGEGSGLDGLEKALMLRFYSNLNDSRIDREDGALYFTCVRCTVQEKRAEKGMPLHPCKPVGEIEYSGFADEIDGRIRCECVSCYPDLTDESCRCKWKFTVREDDETR